MKVTKFFKLISLVLSVCFLLAVFTACGNNAKNTNTKNSIPSEEDYFENSPITHKDRDTRPNPDVSKVDVMEATSGEYSAKTEEEFVEALQKFANPNGNKYDALAILGDYDYSEKGEDLLNRFDAASTAWHATVKEEVGDKCIVEISLKDKTNVDMSDQKVLDWKLVNEIECEAYSNIKCTIATNYAKNDVTLSLDIVKVNGNWHFATIASIDKVLNAITTDIY